MLDYTRCRISYRKNRASKYLTSKTLRVRWNGKEHEKIVINHRLPYMLVFIISSTKCSSNFGMGSIINFSNWDRYCCKCGKPAYSNGKNRSIQVYSMYVYSRKEEILYFLNLQHYWSLKTEDEHIAKLFSNPKKSKIRVEHASSRNKRSPRIGSDQKVKPVPYLNTTAKHISM